VLVGQIDTGKLLVPLHDGGPHAAATPLFLVHAGGGEVQCYAELAAGLARPVHGIQSADAAGLQLARYDRDTVCAAYVEAILAQQPQGPFYLGGWSLGGTLALAVAHRLELRGHVVGGVSLFDTRRRDKDEVAQRYGLDTYLGHVLAYSEDEFSNTFSPALLPLRARLSAVAADIGTEALADMLDRRDAWLETHCGFQRSWQDVFVESYRTMHRNASLAHGFAVPSLQAPVHSFWAQASIDSGVDAMCWDDASASTASSHATYPGSHLTIIYGANAGALARRIDALVALGAPQNPVLEACE
jgi:thioesterase domain-containing protein